VGLPGTGRPSRESRDSPRMHPRLGLGLLLAGIASAVLFWPWTKVLEVTAVGTGEVKWCACVAEGDEFVLSFVHSVNRRPVYDTLRVLGDRIVIVKSRYDSFGAGMPGTPDEEGTFTILPDGWIEWTVNREVPEITVRVGRVANHILSIKGREIPLADLAEPGSALSFRVRSNSLFSAMKGRCVP